MSLKKLSEKKPEKKSKTEMKQETARANSKTAYWKNNRICRLMAAGILGFLFACALPAMLLAEGDMLGYTNSILSVFVWFGASYLMNRILQKDFEHSVKKWFVPGLFSLLFSVCMVFGAQLEKKESIAFAKLGLWVSIVVLGICFTLTVRYFWDLFLDFKTNASGKETGKENGEEVTAGEKKQNRRSFFLTAVAIFLCYVPVFLAVYPGFFVYDAQDELMQVITRNFSTHHPLIHVLMMGGIIQLVYKITGSYNLGIACYTLFQMAVLSGIFSYVICRLKKEGMKKAGRIGIALYFGLFPTIVMFSLCSAKDGLFTGMVLLLLLMFRELLQNPQSFFEKKVHVFLLAGAALGMMLLRHNGYYAFLVFVVFLALTGKMTGLFKVWKKLLGIFAIVVAGYILINTAMTFVLQADASENQELLTVPIQQMARVYVNEGDTLTEEDRNALYEILPKEALVRYVPKVSDGVKIDFNNEAYAANPSRYLKLWLKLGAEHPFTYLNAWFMTSYGFWYPDAVIDVYRGNSVFTFTYGDSSYFGFEVELPGERQSRLPLLKEVYRNMSLEIFQQKVPVLSMLFSPGFLFWVTAFVLGFFWYVGDYKRLFPYVLPLFLWLTVILGPTYLVRYVVFLWFLLPVLIWDLWNV